MSNNQIQAQMKSPQNFLSNIMEESLVESSNINKVSFDRKHFTLWAFKFQQFD